MVEDGSQNQNYRRSISCNYRKNYVYIHAEIYMCVCICGWIYVYLFLYISIVDLFRT
uniref:Alternative protein IARS2 n=1 Tax=Homo sapiens TaxID=9606 RepID=L8EA13_HUMAN|nr:alternative protein IARS2 [Homo sapiens]